MNFNFQFDTFFVVAVITAITLAYTTTSALPLLLLVAVVRPNGRQKK